MLLKSIVVLTVLAVSVIAYSKFSTVKKMSTHPEEFQFRIGGFLGNTYVLNYDSQNETLVFQSFSPKGEAGSKIPAKLSSDEWLDLYKTLSDNRVWKWKKEYIDPNVLDGTQWYIKIKWSGKSIESRGSNKYPKKKYWEALNEKLFSYYLGDKPKLFSFQSSRVLGDSHRFYFNYLTNKLSMQYTGMMSAVDFKTVDLNAGQVEEILKIFNENDLWSLSPDKEGLAADLNKLNDSDFNKKWIVQVEWKDKRFNFNGFNNDNKLKLVHDKLLSFFE